MKNKNELKNEIREIIEAQLIEQDNQYIDEIGMMREDGLYTAVKEIVELIEEEKDWKAIGRNKEGEDIYINKKGKRAVEKDHEYLVVKDK